MGQDADAVAGAGSDTWFYAELRVSRHMEVGLGLQGGLNNDNGAGEDGIITTRPET